jgi:hypothetical protein
MIGLACFECKHFGRGVEMRSHTLNYFQSAHTMSDRHDRVTVNALTPRPLPPLAIHRTGGINKHSVKIKKNG